MKKFFKILSIITKCFVLIIPTFLFSQKINSIKKIDSIYAKTIEERKKYIISLNHIIKVNYELAHEAKNINYKYGEVRSLITLGKHFNNIDKNKESIEYLNLASELNKELNNYTFKVQIYTEYAKNYYNLGDYNKSLNYYNEALRIIKSDKSLIKNKEYLSYVYGCKASTFQSINQKDSLYANIIAANKTYENPIETARIARFHLLYNNDFDSCQFYLKKADSLLNTGKFIKLSKAIILRIYGLSSFKSKDYNKAINYYKESIDLSKKINKISESSTTVMMLYDVYVAIGNKEEQLNSLREYNELNTKITTQKNNALLYVMNKSVSEEKKTSNRLLYVLIISITLGLLSSSLFYVFHKKTISRKRNLLSKKEEENTNLKQKLTIPLEELEAMAKRNDSAFLAMFQERYPHFTERLLEINPNLAISEIRFCAMLTFNFTTKEIARFTVTSPKTIENKKNRIRKRLNIPIDQIINLWIREIL